MIRGGRSGAQRRFLITENVVDFGAHCWRVSQRYLNNSI